jgi:hypothetical protein
MSQKLIKGDKSSTVGKQPVLVKSSEQIAVSHNNNKKAETKAKVRKSPEVLDNKSTTIDSEVTQPVKQPKKQQDSNVTKPVVKDVVEKIEKQNKHAKNDQNNNNNNNKQQNDPNSLVQLSTEQPQNDKAGDKQAQKADNKKGGQNGKKTENKTDQKTDQNVEKDKKKYKVELPPLPKTLPIVCSIPQQALTMKLPQSITQQGNIDPKATTDPSLEYYNNPLSAPIIKEAGQYFASLPPNSYLLDWNGKIGESAQKKFNSEQNNTENNDANISQNQKVQNKLYNFEDIFSSCECCQKSTHVTKNIHHETAPKDQQCSSDKVQTRYPFRVIMDTKDMWRTHGKFAIRPCSDHNLHLSLNYTKDNYAQPKNKDDEEENKTVEQKNDKKLERGKKVEKTVPEEPQQGENYGKKNLSQGSAQLYRYIKPCSCNGAHIGLFSEGTRCITPGITNSPSHHPLLNHALKLFSEAVTKNGTQPYSDIDGSGYLRYVVISVPNTVENNLYQKWWTETRGGLHNDFKSSKKTPPRQIEQVINYPQVQLSIIWAEGIHDEIKKEQKLIDIDPLLNLPFPYALDELKRPIFKPAPVKKGGDKNKKEPTSNDGAAAKPPTTTAPITPENLIKTKIPYAQERQGSRRALYALIKTLATELKTVQKGFIEYANHFGYDVKVESLWQKEMGYYYQDKQEDIIDKQPEEYKDVLNKREQHCQYASTYSATQIPPLLQADDSGSVVSFPYNVPLCSQCFPNYTNNEQKTILKPELQKTIHENSKTNPNSLKMPIVDSINTLPTFIWGSIFVHYNNNWSHSNSVYSLHKHSWHHVFGKHSIDEHVMNAGIPLTAIDYKESYKLIPQQHSSGAVTTSKKNTVMKFSDQDGDEIDLKKHQKTSKNPTPIVMTPTTTLAVPKFSFSPSVFRQGNLQAFSHLLHHLLTLLPSNAKHIVEMHSGCGTISLHTLHHTQLLTASDVNANNKVTFQHATSQLSSIGSNGEQSAILYDKKVLPYIPLSSDELMKEEITFADVVIVDPPRKGLDKTTLQFLSLPWVNPRTLYPAKNGGWSVGGTQPKPTLFPFDLNERLYVNRAVLKEQAKKQQMKDDSDSDSDGDSSDDDNEAVLNKNETGTSINKNMRDKKKWQLEYGQIIRKHHERGTTLYSNTKEHHAEQLSKVGGIKNKGDVKKEFKKNLTTGYDAEQGTEIITLPEVDGLHWLQTARVLVYVSCGFAAFKHDCDVLTKGPGKWRIAHTHAHLLFPGSNHIETLTVFVRGVDQ